MANVISLPSIPPYKQTPANKNERILQKARREALRTKAREICKSPRNDYVSLDILYWRGKGGADPANIIGGIADALQGIVYDNDSQIKTIHYSERKGGEDLYTISVKWRRNRK